MTFRKQKGKNTDRSSFRRKGLLYWGSVRQTGRIRLESTEERKRIKTTEVDSKTERSVEFFTSPLYSFGIYTGISI